MRNNVENKFYSINEDPISFVIIQRRGTNLCYCIKCDTLFEIENVWFDHIYRCPNCNEASVIAKDNKHHNLYLEVISQKDSAVRIINETLSYSLVDTSNVPIIGNVPNKVRVWVDSDKKILEFSAKSFVENSHVWELIDTNTAVDPVKFLHTLFRSINVPAEVIGFNYHTIYEMICDFFFGEFLPVKELIAQIAYNKFPIFGLSSDFLDAMKYKSNRELFKDKNIKTMEELCTLLELPYKSNVVKILTKKGPGDIDFKAIKIFCSYIENLDFKTDLLNSLIEDPISCSDWSSCPSNDYLTPQIIHDLHFLISDFKEQLSEKQLLKFIKSLGHSEYINDTLRMYRTVANSDTYENINILYDNRKGLTAEKLHEILSEYSTILRMKEADSPFAIDSDFKSLYEDKMGDISFVLPKKPSDLASWSTKMGNCISSYSDKFRYGTNILLGIFYKNELLYNMEIKDGQVIQLRGRKNSREIKHDHLKIISKYLKKRCINHDFVDLDVKSSYQKYWEKISKKHKSSEEVPRLTPRYERNW